MAPSAVLTEHVQLRLLLPEVWQEQAAAMFPLGQTGASEDAALTTPFLASDSSSWLTGITYG